MSNLVILSKHHDYWLKIVKSFGETNPEDFVQDMYIIAHDNKKVIEDSKPNFAYIYAILRSLWLKFKKSQTTLELPKELKEIDEEQYKHWVDDLSHEMLKEIERLPFFDGTIFKLVHESGKSVRKISKESKITERTIWYSYNKTKEQLIDKFKIKYDDCKKTG